MSKTIYVTVAEFEENGGILKEGREIFSAGGQAFYEFNAEKEDEYKIFVVGKHGNSGTVGRAGMLAKN